MFDKIKIKLRENNNNNNRQPKHTVPSIRTHKQYLFIFRRNKLKTEALLQSGWQIGVLLHALLIGFRDCNFVTIMKL